MHLQTNKVTPKTILNGLHEITMRSRPINIGGEIEHNSQLHLTSSSHPSAGTKRFHHAKIRQHFKGKFHIYTLSN